MRAEAGPQVPTAEYQQGLSEIKTILSASTKAQYQKGEEKLTIETKRLVYPQREGETIELYHSITFNGQGFQAELSEAYELQDNGITRYGNMVSSNFIYSSPMDSISLEPLEGGNLELKKQLEERALAVFRSMRDYPSTSGQDSKQST